MENIFLCVKDEDGDLRPMAGIWRDDEYGNLSAEAYKKKNKNVTIAKVIISEVKE